jgi:thiol-disulfide isomerase/thioredoxin
MGLRDLNGRVWKLADLKGKVAFVNLWASWCGPCREELPYVEKLHESLKGREDTVVLSLNVDDEPDKARKYAAEHKLTIPVVMAADYVRKEIGPAISIPRSWIVGPDGMLTAEHKGFDPRQTEGWVEAARQEIERARH